MKILFLTQYYPPEVGAPQNRLHDLAVRFKKSDVTVEILTAMPNYPKMEIHPKYKSKIYFKEEVDNIQVYRSWIYVTKNKRIFNRLLNYFSFVFTSFWVGLFKTKRYDYILCESPPLFLGITAYLLCFFKKSKLIFNVSDLWPESAEKLNLVSNKFFLYLAYKLEAFLYLKSKLITGQTQGIVANIQKRFSNLSPYWLPNGVDLSYYNPDTIVKTNWRGKNNFSTKDVIFLYAGIIGHAQGLEVILKAAKIIDNPLAKFVLLGDGPVKKDLLLLKERLNLENVFFLPSVPKKEIFSIIQSIDVVIVPLKKVGIFLGAIPSKIFENLAMKKALLLGVDGEAKKLFIDEGNCGLFFEPENENELSARINELLSSPLLVKKLGENGREYVSKKFDREKIAGEFKEFLNKIK